MRPHVNQTIAFTLKSVLASTYRNVRRINALRNHTGLQRLASGSVVVLVHGDRSDLRPGWKMSRAAERLRLLINHLDAPSAAIVSFLLIYCTAIIWSLSSWLRRLEQADPLTERGAPRCWQHEWAMPGSRCGSQAYRGNEWDCRCCLLQLLLTSAALRLMTAGDINSNTVIWSPQSACLWTGSLENFPRPWKSWWRWRVK